MEIEIVVIDDNKSVVEGIGTLLYMISTQKHIDIKVYTFTNLDGFGDFIKTHKIDICFLDIELGCNINGITLAKQIKKNNYKTLLIFLSSYDNYYKDLVQVEPFRFLSKPFSQKSFNEIFEAACNRVLHLEKKKCYYTYSINGINFRTDLNDVLYISSYKRKVYMLNNKGETIEFYGKLDDVEQEIKELSDNFLRINKSYLINKLFVSKWGKNDVTIGDNVLNVSSKYKPFYK